MNENETQIFRSLSTNLGQQRGPLQILNSYYDCAQELEQLGLAIPPELRRFVTIAGWPMTVVDTLEERCDVEGFRLAGAKGVDDELSRIWQENDLDEESQLAHVDALVYGRTFVCVGANEEDEDTPLTTIESPLEMTCQIDTRSRRIVAALRSSGASPVTNLASESTLYLPDVTIWLARDNPGGRWEEVRRDEHNLGVVPVVMLANRPRTAATARFGRSQMVPVMGLTDACARALTNLQVAQESHAVPQRMAAGMKVEDFIDPVTKLPIPAWQTYFTAIGATSNPDAKFTQYSASDLKNFETVVNLYAHQVAGVSGLPVRYFGQNTANPPSADAIRADEARLVKQAERHNRSRSGGWEQWARLTYRIKTGKWSDDLKRLETVWRNPATPTEAQRADAVVKLVQSDVLPREAAWEEMGYSPERREQLKAMFAEQEAVASADPSASPREIAELVQKVYLGVGSVLTRDEARSILRRAGADLSESEGALAA